MVDVQYRSLKNELTPDNRYNFRPGPNSNTSTDSLACNGFAPHNEKVQLTDALQSKTCLLLNESESKCTKPVDEDLTVPAQNFVQANMKPLLNGFNNNADTATLHDVDDVIDRSTPLVSVEDLNQYSCATSTKILDHSLGGAALLNGHIMAHDYFNAESPDSEKLVQNSISKNANGLVQNEDQKIETDRNSIESADDDAATDDSAFGEGLGDDGEILTPCASTPLVSRAASLRTRLRSSCAGSAPALQQPCATPTAAAVDTTLGVNVKFAQTTPPNSVVDMSSNDYLPGDSYTTASNINMQDTYSAKNHHKTVQERYIETRKRQYTDPVDFEGILRIIGGCGRWQLWVYLLISLQQIPHAMFNLNVIYMMFKPDHWCYQHWFYTKDEHGLHPTWTNEYIRNVSTPRIYDPVLKQTRYDGCSMYNRGDDTYHDLSHMSFHNASMVIDYNVSIKTCDRFTYDESVMKETIVSQWGLVCNNNFHRADAQLAYALGYFIGCLVSGLSSDRFGRKPTLIGFGMMASMFGMLLPYANHFRMFLLIRFLSAVCNEAADLAAYVLCMEVTGTTYRSTVGCLLQLPWALGYTLLAGLAYWTRSWRTIQIVTAAVHTVSIALLCLVPESPRWLIVSNRVREAEIIIRKACRMNKSELPPDLELVKHAEQRKWVKYNERATLLHVLKSCELIVRTLVVFVLWITTALVYYGISLNLSDQSAPGGKMFSGDFFVNNAVAGAVEIPTLLLCCVMLRYGRKRSQMITLILAGIMMLGVVLSPAHGPSRLLFMLLGKMCIQGAFNILYIFTSELYPTVIRNSAVGTCSMVARMGAGVTGYLAILSDVTMPTAPMIIFGVFSLVAGAVVVFLPETRDMPLPETLHDAVVFLKPRRHLPTACMGLSYLIHGGGGPDSSCADSCDRTLPRQQRDATVAQPDE